MSWITPLGFLGLIGIAILILIYILKPNYQQKFISSTFVWELSLKYRKKKIPINKFRNILLFLCQILVITACAFILAQPIMEEQAAPTVVDKVAIIDASAGMRTEIEGETRFERAVTEVKILAQQVFDKEGYITVIVAGEKAAYVAQRNTAEEAMELTFALDELVEEDACTYGVADMKGAIELAQKIVDQNTEAEVVLYTGTEYIDHGAVTVVDVSEIGEWNAAILNCEALVEENYYTFKVSVATYNRDTDLLVHCDVMGANDGRTVRMELPVRCINDETKTVTFVTQNMTVPVYEYESVHVYVSEADSFAADNDFYIYGGKKPEINVLYYSPRANNFFEGVLMGLRDTLSSRWTFNLTEITKQTEKAEIPVIGYDFYVFEHDVPDVMPRDGVVMLVNMDKIPEGLSVVAGNEVNGEFNLSTGKAHPIIEFLSPESVILTQYTKLIAYDGFEPLLYCAGDPVLLVKESDGQQIVLMTFSVNSSDLTLFVDFPIMMYNMFEYFIPSTLTKHAFDINEKITLNARGDSLTVESTNGALKQTLETFPAELILNQPGSYTLSQVPLSGIPVVEQFFVKIPSTESNINKTVDSLEELIIPKKHDNADLDLLIYFAAALVGLMLIERLLQSQDM